MIRQKIKINSCHSRGCLKIFFVQIKSYKIKRTSIVQFYICCIQLHEMVIFPQQSLQIYTPFPLVNIANIKSYNTDTLYVSCLYRFSIFLHIELIFNLLRIRFLKSFYLFHCKISPDPHCGPTLPPPPRIMMKNKLESTMPEDVSTSWRFFIKWIFKEEI